MSYRNIEVNGTNYKYVVGKTHVKIRGVGVFLKEDVGTKVETECECCGEPLSELYSDIEPTYVVRVTPSDIKKLLHQL